LLSTCRCLNVKAVHREKTKKQDLLFFISVYSFPFLFSFLLCRVLMERK
jgi:hypothetical protein